MWAQALALGAVAVLGFLCGLVTFRRSLRWCRECGETLRCPHCVPARTGRCA
ncbi:MAG: hypothetical protein ACRDT6_14420 [Micromonosporaceae bacterium]